MSLIEVSGLRKAYGQRLILHIEQLSLKRGCSYLLTGSNGAGKTTLLRVLAGLEPAQMTSYAFEGKAIALHELAASLSARVVYLHQQPYLFSTSVVANIAYGLKATGRLHAEQKALVEEAMSWAGLHHVAHIAPHRLSGGEQRRVALARAHVLNPDVLLLDEPTANLDEAARRQVALLIRRMCDNNHCVVIATHDPELIAVDNALSLHLQNMTLSRR